MHLHHICFSKQLFQYDFLRQKFHRKYFEDFFLHYRQSR